LREMTSGHLTKERWIRPSSSVCRRRGANRRQQLATTFCSVCEKEGEARYYAVASTDHVADRTSGEASKAATTASSSVALAAVGTRIAASHRWLTVSQLLESDSLLETIPYRADADVRHVLSTADGVDQIFRLGHDDAGVLSNLLSQALRRHLTELFDISPTIDGAVARVDAA
jgi:hypothetical protein